MIEFTDKLSWSEFFFMETFYFRFGYYKRSWDHPSSLCLLKWALVVVLFKKKKRKAHLLKKSINSVGTVVNDTLLSFSMSVRFVVMSPLILNIVDSGLFFLSLTKDWSISLNIFKESAFKTHGYFLLFFCFQFHRSLFFLLLSPSFHSPCLWFALIFIVS